MYEFKPQRTNDRAQKLVLLFFIGAAALLLVTVPLKGMPFLWIIQLFAVILIVAAVFLVTRYITRSYIYSIDVIDGRTDLTVTEVSSGGKRQIAVCRIGLAGIESVREIDGRDGELAELRKARKRIFDYRPDLLPEKSLLVSAEECGEKLLILLAYDEALLKILRGDLQ
jgi:hypothetical protein